MRDCRGENDSHTDDCPHNTPGANVRYETGYADGRRGRECASRDTDYVAGYLAGEIALESAENGFNAWG